MDIVYTAEQLRHILYTTYDLAVTPEGTVHYINNDRQKRKIINFDIYPNYQWSMPIKYKVDSGFSGT